MSRKYTKQLLEDIVQRCYSFRQVLKELELREAGGNYKNIQTRIKDFEISTDHFTGKLWNKGKVYISKNNKFENWLVEDSKYSSGLPYSTNKLRLGLLKRGYKDHKCESCGLTEWMGEPIKLEIHHINGINNDNRLENLKLLCPNCHAYTDNYRGKNK